MFDYAMDLGTSSVLLYREGKGIVLREPSVVAMRRSSGSVVGAGQKARDMLGRTPEDLLAVRPVRGGVITDCSIAGAMTKIFLKRAGCGGFLRPNLLVCVPPLVSELEERAVIDAGMQAGASRVYLMEQPVAAAAGAGVDPDSPKGTLVIDIGGGTTDLAVISLGAVVCAASIRIAGDSCDDAIQAYVKQQHDLLIGISAAEQIKQTIGSVLPRDELCSVPVRGRRVSTGLPACETVTSEELMPLLREQAELIRQAVCALLERTPPELASDIMKNGIYLTGRAAQLYALDQYIANELNIQVILAKDPGDCTVLGLGYIVENLALLAQQGRMPQLN